MPTFASVEEENHWLRANRDTLQHEIAELRLNNAILTNTLYGRKSEKVRERDQEIGQQRLFEQPVADDATGPDVSDDESSSDQKMAKKKRGEATKRTHARKPVNKELACITHDYGAEGPQFDADGVELVITGWDERERLHHIPHQVVREISRYAIWGYADSRETVATTPILPAVIPGGKLTDDFLIEIGLRKYLYSQPLYRQLVDYNGLGAELAESTLCNGIKALATFLKPIAEAIEAQVLSESVIAIDETTMRQQDDEHGMVIRYLWGWLGGGQVSYHYGGRGAKEILTVLQRHPPPDPSLPRYALTDGYVAYDSPLTAAGFIHAGCWTHIRREFKPLAPSFQHAKEVFDLINKLYRIEKQIKKECAKRQMSPEDACRHAEAVRHEKAKPILDHIATAYETYAHLYQPETAMRKAFNQLGNQFEKLRVYATTGHVPIDNNEVERGMRLVAVGRKNYLFVGSEDAGEWCATMYTIVESCRMGNRDVRDYLQQAVAGLHAGQSPSDLTPQAMRRKIRKAKRD